MNEELKNLSKEEKDAEIQKDFNNGYFKRVHLIGRSSMAIALVFAFAPVLYMQFVKGWSAPLSSYLNVAFAIAALCGGFWVTDPIQWFPILGAASVYMGNLAGNTKNIRVPVARQLRNKYGFDALSPKSQILTTIGVAMSVFTNLVILTVIVLVGNWLVSILPDIVIESFSYVIPSLIGALLAFRVIESGIVKTLKWSIPPLVIYGLMCTGIFPFLNDFGMSVSIAITVLIGYGVYKHQVDQDKEEQ